MKHKNVKVGQKVQLKCAHQPYSAPVIPKGTIVDVVAVEPLDYEGGTLTTEFHYQGVTEWLSHKDIKKVVEVPTPIEVGDRVLVGAEGAGHGLVLKEYAGLVCTVTDIGTGGEACVYIVHPNVMSGLPYVSKLQYLTKIPKEELVEVPEQVTFVEGELVELPEGYTTKCGEYIRAGYYRLAVVYSLFQTGISIIRTEKGEGGTASIPTEKLRKVQLIVGDSDGVPAP